MKQKIVDVLAYMEASRKLNLPIIAHISGGEGDEYTWMEISTGNSALVGNISVDDVTYNVAFREEPEGGWYIIYDYWTDYPDAIKIKDHATGFVGFTSPPPV